MSILITKEMQAVIRIGARGIDIEKKQTNGAGSQTIDTVNKDKKRVVTSILEEVELGDGIEAIKPHCGKSDTTQCTKRFPKLRNEGNRVLYQRWDMTIKNGSQVADKSILDSCKWSETRRYRNMSVSQSVQEGKNKNQMNYQSHNYIEE